MEIVTGNNIQNTETVAQEAIGRDQLTEFTTTLQKYQSGKTHLEHRVKDAEDWWKKRNSFQEQKDTVFARANMFHAQSGWLHNIIVNKHADVMDSFPEPNILAREEADKAEAKKLSSIVPCVLEMNSFEKTYSDVMWQKIKTGTGVYKIFWDAKKLNGLGDIAIERVDLLNIFWQPGITDIQKSKYVFHTELVDRSELSSIYPELKEENIVSPFTATKFRYDDTVTTDDKITVIEVYYKKWQNGKKVLHYCKYVGDHVLYATENQVQPQMAAAGEMKPPISETGLYDHGMYPFVFDTLFPVEGSPCGYGYVDTHSNSQTVIDLMNTAIIQNTMVGATPRYFTRADGAINEAEFLDLTKPVVHVNGNLGDDSLKIIDYKPLSGHYLNAIDYTINELRQTSGNTETATGSSAQGVTAASAIAALQEASGKSSRDSTAASYRAYSEIINIVIELIRQFYDMPRQFRITGTMGQEQFVTYTNAGIQPVPQGNLYGMDMGYRLPVFDIKVSAQKRNAYTKMSQNELALQFYQMGFFNPNMTDQALATLDMMDFDSKDSIQQKIVQNGTMFQKLVNYQQLALTLAAKYGDQQAMQVINQDVMGGQPQPGGRGVTKKEAEERAETFQADKEDTRTEKARKQANEAAQPNQ